MVLSEAGRMKRVTGSRRTGEVGVADGSAIEWTTATWNPTTGCDRVSAGCDSCYALTLAGRGHRGGCGCRSLPGAR